jgi:hypothetical protein
LSLQSVRFDKSVLVCGLLVRKCSWESTKRSDDWPSKLYVMSHPVVVIVGRFSCVGFVTARYAAVDQHVRTHVLRRVDVGPQYPIDTETWIWSDTKLLAGSGSRKIIPDLGSSKPKVNMNN